MVGHSIGGLMIKEVCSKPSSTAFPGADYHDKAALQENNEDHKLPKRVRALFFLATPHQNASAPDLHRRIILACTNPRNLRNTQDMGQMQTTNDEFTELQSEILLWSFYESLESELNGTSALVLEKASAVIGMGAQLPIVKLPN